MRRGSGVRLLLGGSGESFFFLFLGGVVFSVNGVLIFWPV